MRRDFEGGVYWVELADRCGDISRAAGFRGAARFRGNTVSLVCVLFDPAIPTSFFNFIQLFQSLYMFLFFFVINFIMICSLSGRWEVRKILCHAPH